MAKPKIYHEAHEGHEESRTRTQIGTDEHGTRVEEPKEERQSLASRGGVFSLGTFWQETMKVPCATLSMASQLLCKTLYALSSYFIRISQLQEWPPMALLMFYLI